MAMQPRQGAWAKVHLNCQLGIQQQLEIGYPVRQMAGCQPTGWLRVQMIGLKKPRQSQMAEIQTVGMQTIEILRLIDQIARMRSGRADRWSS